MLIILLCFHFFSIVHDDIHVEQKSVILNFSVRIFCLCQVNLSVHGTAKLVTVD